MGDVVRLEDKGEARERPPGLPATCTDAALKDAVRDYLLGESFENLAKRLGVTKGFPEGWQRSPLWGALAVDLLPEAQDLLRGRLTRSLAQTLNLIDARIAHGDVGYTREGEKYTRELSALTLATLASRLAEIQRGIEKIDDSKPPQDGRMDLNELAKALRHRARQSPPIDVTPSK